MKPSRRLAFALAALSLGGIVVQDAHAQGPDKPQSDAIKTGTTIDAWRAAAPQIAEVPDTTLSPAASDGSLATPGAEAPPTLAQTERRLTTLEHRWLEAVKLRDQAALQQLLADDFTLTGAPATAGALLDKSQYLAGTLRDVRLESFKFNNVSVRLYGTTAVLQARFTQQGTTAGRPLGGDFLLTDVWVRENKRWQIVSRHLSQPANPQ